MKPTKGLRFAPIIRVSTEGQAQKGHSLKTQKEQIQRAVQILGGTIPGHCWRYSGQEHATPDQERRKLDQLLEDARKDLFDAVIVCDASRWSRDNRKGKEGLEVLRTNGIRFFVGTTEYDLFNPEQLFFLGMATEVNEYAASASAWKSVINDGKDEHGKPFGVYLRKEGEKWCYTITGRLMDKTSRLPMSTAEAQGLFGVQGDAPEDWNPVDYLFKSDILSGNCPLPRLGEHEGVLRIRKNHLSLVT